MTTLTDGRLTLRTPSASDAAAVADAVRDSFDALAPWMPWASAVYDEAAALHWMSSGETSFAILDHDGTFVGTCGLNGFDELNHRANLGYWVRSAHTGRGIASAAAVLVARHGLVDLALVRLEVIMSVRGRGPVSPTWWVKRDRVR